MKAKLHEADASTQSVTRAESSVTKHAPGNQDIRARARVEMSPTASPSAEASTERQIERWRGTALRGGVAVLAIGLLVLLWWAVAVLSLVATVCAAIASHWTIALPGLLPVGIAVALARRRARQERLMLVEPDVAGLPPRATFTSAGPSGKR